MNKIIIVFLIVCALGYLLTLLPSGGWFNFLGKGALYSVIYSLLIYKFGTLEHEKEMILKPILKVFRK